MLLVVMMRSMERGRNAIAGSALALATLMRVFPIAMAGYLVLTRRWRTLGYTVATLIVGIAITVTIAGVRNCIDFALSVPTISRDSWNMIPRDLAAQLFISRQLQSILSSQGDSAVIIRRALTLSLDLLLLVATVRATLSLPDGKDTHLLVFALWVATAIFLLPVAWDYDLVLMLIPFSQLAVLAARGEASRRAIAMAILSYLLLFWWEFIALSQNESGFFSMLTAYLSAYWLAIDQRDSVRVPLRRMPTEILRRLTLAT
jgi:hypothetical protein